MPASGANESEIAQLIGCVEEAREIEDSARNDMIVRLRDLYKLLDGANEKRLDESQDKWLDETAQTCPDLANEDGTIHIEASDCMTARYKQRSALFDEIIDGCRAGSCPIDKL